MCGRNAREEDALVQQASSTPAFKASGVHDGMSENQKKVMDARTIEEAVAALRGGAEAPAGTDARALPYRSER